MSFDAAGRETGVAGGGASYVSNARYYPSGAMLDWRLGPNQYEMHGYNRRGQLQDLRLGGSAQSFDKWRLQNIFAGGQNNGNIVAQTLTLPGGATVNSGYKYLPMIVSSGF